MYIYSTLFDISNLVYLIYLVLQHKIKLSSCLVFFWPFKPVPIADSCRNVDSGVARTGRHKTAGSLLATSYDAVTVMS